jgi:exonuclease III
MIKVVSWNCRGLGSEKKKALVKSLVQAETLQVLILQEIKLKDEEVLQYSRFMWNFSKGKSVSSQGDSSGLFTLWNPHIFGLEGWECASN